MSGASVTPYKAQLHPGVHPDYNSSRQGMAIQRFSAPSLLLFSGVQHHGDWGSPRCSSCWTQVCATPCRGMQHISLEMTGQRAQLASSHPIRYMRLRFLREFVVFAIRGEQGLATVSSRSPDAKSNLTIRFNLSSLNPTSCGKSCSQWS